MVAALRGREERAAPAAGRSRSTRAGSEACRRALGDEEATRQADLARLVALAEEFGGDATAADFVAILAARFGVGDRGPRRQHPHLPPGEGARVRGRVPAAARGRRAAYRARTDGGGGGGAAAPLRRDHPREAVPLPSRVRGQKPSRFLTSSASSEAATRRAAWRSPRTRFAALREWRLRRAKEDGVPAYVVFHDRTLAAIADRSPASLDELRASPESAPRSSTATERRCSPLSPPRRLPPMGRGSRPKVRWKNERQRKKKAREVRKNPPPPPGRRRLQPLGHPVRHQDRVDELAARPAVVLTPVALALEAELLVEPDRRLVVGEDVSSILRTPAPRAHSSAVDRSARPIPRRRQPAATMSPRSATCAEDGCWSRESESRATISPASDSPQRRPRGIAPDRLQIPALVPDRAPVARRDQPAARLAAHLAAERHERGRVPGLRRPDPPGRAHAPTTIPWPPRRESPAAASVPSARSSTAATPPKNRFRRRQRVTA